VFDGPYNGRMTIDVSAVRTPMLTSCPDCAAQRQEGDLRAALGCRGCSGTGIRRKRESWKCNQCGGSLCPDVEGWNGQSPDGLVEAKVRGHYDSTHLSDTTIYQFSICEACLRRLFNGFVIPPKMGEYYLDGSGESFLDEDTYEKERSAHETRLWRKDGGHIAKMRQGLCNGTMACPNKAIWRRLNMSHLTWDACCDEHSGVTSTVAAPVSIHQVPYELVADMSGDDDELTMDQVRRLTRIWFALSHRTKSPVTLYRYVTHDVARLVDRPAWATGQDTVNPQPWMAWVSGQPNPDGVYGQIRKLVGADKVIALLNFEDDDPTVRAALPDVLTQGTLLILANEEAARPLLTTPSPLATLEM